MRIVQLTPGTGNFYCGACLRDNALVRALRRMGHDAVLLPMYLPHFVDEESMADDGTLFFGGINVYLQQKLAFFRRAPAWIDRLFNAAPLLRLAAAQAGMTSARDLGEMTISMALGESGRQAKELEKVVSWLAQEENRPEVVSLSNLLLIGLARCIREKLGVPVICTLQGEDSFIDSLPDAERCWDLLRARTADVTMFVAVSQYYKETLCKRLRLAPERVSVVHNGISLDGYAPAAQREDAPPVIGFLARMHPGKGLDLLVRAFIALKRRGDGTGVRLRIAGSCMPADRPFVGELRHQLRQAGCERDVEFLPNLDRAEKQAFLQTLNVLSVPAPGESFGLYVIEALAAGVPVVLPADGAFPELVKATGGGILCAPGDAEALAATLEEAIGERSRLAAMGAQGRAVVSEKFTSEAMAGAFAAVCQKALPVKLP